MQLEEMTAKGKVAGEKARATRRKKATEDRLGSDYEAHRKRGSLVGFIFQKEQSDWQAHTRTHRHTLSKAMLAWRNLWTSQGEGPRDGLNDRPRP